jgi:hypothetical protein
MKATETISFWVADLTVFVGLGVAALLFTVEMSLNQAPKGNEMVILHDWITICTLATCGHFLVQGIFLVQSMLDRSAKTALALIVIAACDYGIHSFLQFLWVFSVGG